MQKQQARRVLDKGQLLSVFGEYLARKNGGQASDYIQDQVLLNECVRGDKNFPWVEIAAQVNLDRWRLYHWYFETFQRMLAGSIEKEDVTLMRDLIKKAMTNDEPLDKQFQQFVKTSLSKDYHRSSFSIAFNNTKRQVMKELGKTVLPTSRPVIRMESHRDLQQLIQSQQNQLKLNQRQQFEQRQVNFQSFRAKANIQPQRQTAQQIIELKQQPITETHTSEYSSSSEYLNESFEQSNSFINEHVTVQAETNLQIDPEYEVSVTALNVNTEEQNEPVPRYESPKLGANFIVFDKM
ncbi:Conserved_hypothetical protein [Hexamita inflata]|uniref:Uncharacterized protein n=1 Tax=Hexamita inflata TaxID=28002 RepID=A0AA86NU27_9EUKA|nr:Conserved hypothetical protein [Hexamita inflata]